MMFKLLAIATVFVGGAAMGHGGVEGAAAAQLALGPDLQTWSAWPFVSSSNRTVWLKASEALGEALGATGDGAVLTVRPHDASVVHPAFGCEVQILDFTAGGSRWFDGAIEKGGHDDDTGNRGSWPREQGT